MKKSFISIVLTGFIVCLGLGLFSSSATAAGVADGAWSTGREVTLDIAANLELQSFGNGVVITAPAEICHAFSGGQFGWVAVIRRFVDGVWVKVPTTQGWIPNTEGTYTACAQAPSAGTYALFAYYVRPKNWSPAVEPPVFPACKDVTIEGKVLNYPKDGEAAIRLDGFTGIIPGDAWTFELFSIKDFHDVDVVVDAYTNDFVYDSDNTMYEKLLKVSEEVDKVTLRVNTPTCYVDLELSAIVD